MKILKVSAQVTIPSGTLEINDGVHYRLEANTLSARQVAFRRQQTSSPFLPGTYTINAVPDTIMETVAVYVEGSDAGDMRRRLELLTAAMTQRDYTITWEFDDDYYAWICQVADYSIDTRREFQHARMAIATFQVPRYPALVRS